MPPHPGSDQNQRNCEKAAHHRSVVRLPRQDGNADADNSARVISIGWPTGRIPSMLRRLHRIDLQPIRESPRGRRVMLRVTGYASWYKVARIESIKPDAAQPVGGDSIAK
jgi:hypothetical protein